jgi:hypothetical protein
MLKTNCPPISKEEVGGGKTKKCSPFIKKREVGKNRRRKKFNHCKVDRSQRKNK